MKKMNRDTWIEIFIDCIIAFLIGGFFTMLFSSCMSAEIHRRKLLEEYYPDCQVLDDGSLKCKDIDGE